jgi:hypothetical protein
MTIVSRQAASDALKCDLDSSVRCVHVMFRCCSVWTCFVHRVLLLVRILKMEQRINIKFCVTMGKTPTETHEMLRKAYEDKALCSV